MKSKFYIRILKKMLNIVLFFFIPTIICIFYQNFNNTKTSVYMSNGELKGGDFLAFYTGGKLFKEDRKNLYNLNLQRKININIIPTEKDDYKLPFIYPPIIAFLFQKISIFSFLNAFYLYAIFTFLITLLFISYLVINIFKKNKNYWVLLSLSLLFAYVPFTINCILGGQMAWIGIIIVSLSIICSIKNFNFLGGLILSLSYYKPPLFLIFAVYMILTKNKKYFLGFLIGSITLLCFSIILIGFQGIKEYIILASGYTYGQKFGGEITLPENQGAGVFSLISLFIGGKKALLL